MSQFIACLLSLLSRLYAWLPPQIVTVVGADGKNRNYGSQLMIKDRLAAVSPNPIFYARLYYLMRVEVPSVLLLTISSFGLNDSIVLVVDLFKTRSSSALVMLNVIDLPLIAQVPPIVPVTPWPSVLLMKPTGRTWATKLPLALNDMDSLTSPTMLVPNQSPTIVAEYSASLTGART